MHILKGKIGGFRIPVIKGSTARPTTQKVKEIVFELLEKENLINESTTVLDLFAGTGSMSLEFASRGAKQVVFVEVDKINIDAAKAIKNEFNLKNLMLIKNDVFNFLERNKSSFNVVFADPPYKLSGIQNLPYLLKLSKAVEKKSIFILEHEKNIVFDKSIFHDTRIYGKSAFTIFRF